MNEAFPGFGFGQYQYKDKLDCGRHEIQLQDNGKDIFVLTINTSHGQNTTHTLVWRRDEKA